MAKPQLRTCTTLYFADGHGTARYIVMRGRMIGRAFDSAHAEIIGQYTLHGSAEPDYAALTAPFATPDAPAVYWQQRKEHA
jgi:hypothetical protein